MRTEDKTPSAFMPAHVWKKQKSHLCEGRRGWRPAVRPESWTFFFFYIYIYASFFLFASSSCWNRVVLPFSYGSVLVDQFAPRPLYDSLPPKLSIPRLLLTTEEKSLCTHTYTKGEREREQEISRAIVSPSSITVDRDVVDVQPEEEEEEEEKKT